MASGKTTLGKKLANKLNIPFIDSDEKIEEIVGLTIAQIFDQKGEAIFRELETSFLDNYPFPTEFVLSTGGGMPCFNENIDRLSKLGKTFYLQRSSKELTNRLVNTKEQRPLVQSMTQEELEVYIENSLSKRELFYMQANVILDRHSQTPEKIIEFFN